MISRLIPIGEAAKFLGVSIDTLRNWDKKDILASFRPELKGKRYYRQEDIENFISKKPLADHVSLARKWATDKTPLSLSSDLYCETIDIFSARLQSLNIKLEREIDLKAISSLITAIVGEIGNNSFNHNMGNWPDVPGVFFAYDITKRQIILADRGQGILETLKRVLPKLKTDSDAIEIAFTKYISGRAPENRGNGLKFVKDIIFTHPIKLEFYSGDAELKLNENKKLEISRNKKTFHGSIAIINY